MSEKEEKKEFVEPELVKFEEPLDVVTNEINGSPIKSDTVVPSDRNVKENFGSVDIHGILSRLATIPVETWNYKAQGSAIRHIGPMAQDFAAAFGVGEDDRHINIVDAFGVTLASIQALYEVIKEKDARISALEQQVKNLLTGSGRGEH
jgi:hypothetical protein